MTHHQDGPCPDNPCDHIRDAIHDLDTDPRTRALLMLLANTGTHHVAVSHVTIIDDGRGLYIASSPEHPEPCCVASGHTIGVAVARFADHILDGALCATCTRTVLVLHDPPPTPDAAALVRTVHCAYLWNDHTHTYENPCTGALT